ncbi:MAG: hypothetical protein ABGX64_01285, partial [Cycloclasticus sp.]
MDVMLIGYLVAATVVGFVSAWLLTTHKHNKESEALAKEHEEFVGVLTTQIVKKYEEKDAMSSQFDLANK